MPHHLAYDTARPRSRRSRSCVSTVDTTSERAAGSPAEIVAQRPKNPREGTTKPRIGIGGTSRIQRVPIGMATLTEQCPHLGHLGLGQPELSSTGPNPDPRRIAASGVIVRQRLAGRAPFIG